MKIIISGGLGYVGGRLSKYLAQHGNVVVALSRQAQSLTGMSWPEGMSVEHPDDYVYKPERLKGADAFVHLAALNENDCITYPEKAIEVNITQTLNWLDASYKAGIERFVYFSTAHIYGKPLIGYYDEQTLARPLHPYAITHKCAEDYVSSYRAEKGMNNYVIRLTNAFGGPAFPTADRWTLLVNDLCRSAVETGEMKLLSDGQQLRDFIPLSDVCSGIHHVLNLPKEKTDDGIFNLGSGQSKSVWQMALMVKNAAERMLKREVRLTRKEPTGTSTDKLEISCKRLLQTGFTYSGDHESEVISTIEYFLNVKSA